MLLFYSRCKPTAKKMEHTKKSPLCSRTLPASLSQKTHPGNTGRLKLLFDNMRQSPTVLYTNSYLNRYMSFQLCKLLVHTTLGLSMDHLQNTNGNVRQYF